MRAARPKTEARRRGRAQSPLDQSTSAMLSVDESGRIRKANRIARRLLGFSAKAEPDVAGAFPSPADQELLAASLAALGCGETSARHVELRRADDRRIRLRLTLGPETIADRLVVAEIERDSACSLHGEEFEIESVPERFGRLVWHRPAAGVKTAPIAPGTYCFDSVYACISPCAECPARDIAPGQALREVLPADSGWVLHEFRRGEANRVRICVGALDEDWARRLGHARLARTIAGSGLTERERAVLDLVLLGRSRPEISRALQISVRTVKFHEQNLLEKLGADSRIDLLRVLT